MDDQYPEMALFTDFIELRTRIEDLPPLPPSATPRQQGYRDFLQDLLTLPSSIPDQEEPSSDSDDATQNDDLNLLGQPRKTPQQRRDEILSKRIAGIAEYLSMSPISPEELIGLISTPDIQGDRIDSEDRALGRLLRGYMDTQPQEWVKHLGVYQDPSFEWGQNIQQSNGLALVKDSTERLRGRSLCIDKTREWQDCTGYLPFLFAQMEAIRWAIDWERAPGPRGWKKKFVTENFQALPENIDLFEGKSEEERKTQMDQLDDQFVLYKRIVKGKNAAWMRLLEMYRSFGPGVLLDRYWDTRFNVESRSKDFPHVFRELLDLVATIDKESRPNSPSVVYVIQEKNRAALLSVVEVLAGQLYGAELREYVEEFLDDVPTRIQVPIIT